MSSYVMITKKDSLITHSGILGMRWGRRNGPPYPLGASDHSAAEKKAGTKGWSKEAKKEENENIKSSNASSKQNEKEISNMSDDELRNSVSRMQLERTYNDLKTKKYEEVLKQMETERDKGKSVVSKLLKKYGKEVATKTATTALNAFSSKIGNEIGTRAANTVISKFDNKK